MFCVSTSSGTNLIVQFDCTGEPEFGPVMEAIILSLVARQGHNIVICLGRCSTNPKRRFESRDVQPRPKRSCTRTIAHLCAHGVELTTAFAPRDESESNVKRTWGRYDDAPIAGAVRHNSCTSDRGRHGRGRGRGHDRGKLLEEYFIAILVYFKEALK